MNGVPPQISEDELREMLATYQGDRSPVTKARLRRLRPWPAAALATGVIVAAATLAVVLFPRGGTSPTQRPTTGFTGSCGAFITFNNAEYVGNTLHQAGLETGGAVGTATEFDCDTGAQISFAVYRAIGINSTAAIVRLDAPDIIYVKKGICEGYRNENTFLRCLRRQR
jgi:hypothetical protein